MHRVAAEHSDILPGFLRKEREKKSIFISPFLLVVIKSELGAVIVRSHKADRLLVTHVVQNRPSQARRWLQTSFRAPLREVAFPGFLFSQSSTIPGLGHGTARALQQLSRCSVQFKGEKPCCEGPVGWDSV